ncbi:MULTISPECIES: porin family protein [Proteiniphilum]|jgi:hypothetical protein|uniref:porin family protein n=1 Tax=Proteiniphilum TaxID=294702 RepID=UPI001EEA4801|nr:MULTISPECIES: porin family protein [Proteiniphilum]ULB34937.1 PorT family protein [Proteiniphilum propionicum]
MARKMICLTALLLSASFVFPQFHTGIKGGVNLSNVSMNINGIELDSYDPRPGIHAGFMTEYMFGAHLGLHTELIYFNSGANINPGQFKKWFDVSEDVSVTGSLNMHTFQLPLYLKTKFALSPTVKIYLMGGGFATYALKADMFEKLSLAGEVPLKLKWSLYEPNVRIFDQDESNVHLQQRWNAGLAAETGIEIRNSITAGIGFRQVLNNMAAYGIISGGGSIKPTTQMWTATFSVGYFL